MTDRHALSDTRQRRRLMAEYDALPPALRAWLAGARLQWSPGSARRAWRRAMWKSLGRTRKAAERMDTLEDARLAQDPLTLRRQDRAKD
ncbi:DUF6525 family protein [Jannaschia sp. S6380]|uniref:DUF6525 family protein n=1 Tax=Jannaschia sp. S6380 TaxID=2926408 RepID=UPI001FF5A96B|nr:DUF6525 family protein [Jannaschia sp. S6380]MCK0168809.1 DUF6525 family protein [Jannaschia sp. S6380]